MNKLFVLLVCLFYLGIIQQASSGTSEVDKGDHLLICSQEPIEFGIVLDSSVSIPKKDFEKAKEFLVKFLSQFDIGSGENDVRVSIITFGLRIYPKDGFNLDTYKTKQEVMDAIMAIKHRQGPRTDTGLGIKYMHEQQLRDDVVRPTAEKISLVITDGNSQSWRTTEREAKNARADNITIFAIGVGRPRDVSMDELMRIAGSYDRITRVNNFDNLDSIREILAKKTCFKKFKPTTAVPIMTESCGEANPSDIEFFFSPADLGRDATAWTTSFISNTIDAEDMDVGFRYGVSSGSCPMDSGFNLDKYDFADDIHDHLAYYDKAKLPNIIGMDAFSAARGGRNYARDIAVLFVSGGKGTGDLEGKVKELTENGVEVFVANAAGYPVKIGDATPLSGRSSRQQAELLIHMLCPEE